MSLIGKPAPKFKLQNGNFEFVSNEDFIGKRNVVLLFYPLAFSSVCTEELCMTRDNLKIYEAFDAEVLAVSVDSLFVQRAFKKSQNINFEMLSDFNKNTSRDYGTLYEDYFGMHGVSKRSAFVIDKQGIVRYEEIHDKDDIIPDFDKIQKILEDI